MTVYADYAYYTGAYGGKAVSEADWPRLSRAASVYLLGLTDGRIPEEIPEAVSDACCAVAEQMSRTDRGGALVSSSNDGYSETYAADGLTPAARYYEAAALYLRGTGLLCCWV